MGKKTFIEHSGFKLESDERDIMVSNKLIEQVIAWCEQTGVVAEQVDTSPITQWRFGVNLWRVQNEKQRMWFTLRWS